MTHLEEFSFREPHSKGMRNTPENTHLRCIHKPTGEKWLAEHAGQLSEYEKLQYDYSSLLTESKRVPKQPSQALYNYVGHRTAQYGGVTSVVLEFRSLCGTFTAVKFFNVQLTSGNKLYPSGDHGQFNSKKRSNFRVFWKQTVGKDPRRWSRAHKELLPQLRDIVFSGTIVECKDKDGKTFLKFTDIKAREWPNYEH